MRLPRPYVPWSTRRVVIERQLRTAGDEPTKAERYTGSDERATRWMVERLFLFTKVELHHDPALINREIVPVKATEKRKRLDGWFVNDGVLCRYEPEANDPNFLVYMPTDDHDVRTRVRGQHGQHSDLALARKRKRKERKARAAKRGAKYNRKYNWPKRKLRWSRSRSSASFSPRS